VAAASEAASAYKVEHGIADVDEELVLSAATQEELESQLRQYEVELAGAGARLASLNGSIGSTDPNDTGSQVIETGRSQTEVQQNQSNPVYQDLLLERDRVEAQIGDLTASRDALLDRLDLDSAAELTAEQAELLQLERDLVIAETAQQEVSEQYQQALVNAESGTVELTRIDEASLPNYPIAPKRYLYLALGLLIGGLAGGGLTWLAFRREAGRDEGEGVDEEESQPLDLRDRATGNGGSEADERLPVRAGAGAGEGPNGGGRGGAP
jgi:uncharacterized protein involved in exopolysaccharide biosynthesis